MSGNSEPFGDLAEQIHQGLIRSAVLRREGVDTMGTQ
jgi:hypothetical protein